MFDLPPVSRALDDAIRRAIDSKTKPVGALGSIEALAGRIARIQGTLAPSLHRCRLTLFAADHGIAHEGVSAYPQAVTRQMVANFLAGGAAANVFARANGVDLRVVDAGVAGGPIDAPGLTSRRIADGTRNSAVGGRNDRGSMRCGAARRRRARCAGRCARCGVRRDGDREHVLGNPGRAQAHRCRDRGADRPGHRTRRRRARTQARGSSRAPRRAPRFGSTPSMRCASTAASRS